MTQFMPQAYHFTAIGGSAMHSLALALHQQGHTITGSDDEIDDPARTRLQQQGLLPAEMGWFPDRIHPNLTAVILGRHAHVDNPELERARALGLAVLSYPEFIYNQSKQKQRVVIAGSHGKTTITAMILHVLKYHHRKFDYLIGAQTDNLEPLLRLTDDTSAEGAPVIIIEGDEDASSAIDHQPKFLHYKPHMALISGLAWDHVTVYPTYEKYVEPFERLADQMPKSGVLIFDETDNMLDVIGAKERSDVQKVPYVAHPNLIRNGHTYLKTATGAEVPVPFFGLHNLKNVAGALTVCDRLGITDEQFYEAIQSFKGVVWRLETVTETDTKIVFRDFAHAPSQVEAASRAVKAQYPTRTLLACVELPPSDTLNQAYLNEYRHCLDAADVAAVYCDLSALSTRVLAPISPQAILAAFDKPGLQLFTEVADLKVFIKQNTPSVAALLLMGSDAFGGLDFTKLIDNQ